MSSSSASSLNPPTSTGGSPLSLRSSSVDNTGFYLESN
jgi:hypothetical protein